MVESTAFQKAGKKKLRAPLGKVLLCTYMLVHDDITVKDMRRRLRRLGLGNKKRPRVVDAVCGLIERYNAAEYKLAAGTLAESQADETAATQRVHKPGGAPVRTIWVATTIGFSSLTRKVDKVYTKAVDKRDAETLLAHHEPLMPFLA